MTSIQSFDPFDTCLTGYFSDCLKVLTLLTLPWVAVFQDFSGGEL